MIRVLVAEPDAPTAAGLRAALRAAELELCEVARDADAAVAAAQRARPDLVMIATELPGGWVDASARIAAEVRGAHVVVLSADPGEEELLAAVRAGAWGYLGKDVRPERLPDIVEAVLRGEAVLPRRLSGRIFAELRDRDRRRAAVETHASAPLTGREWEVLELLAEDVGTTGIARRLGVSEVTVRRHVSALRAKLGGVDRAGAAALLRRRSAV